MKFYALTYDFVTRDVSRQRGPAAVEITYYGAAWGALLSNVTAVLTALHAPVTLDIFFYNLTMSHRE